MYFGVWVSFVVYFVLMLVIGVYVWCKVILSLEEYILGGCDLFFLVMVLLVGVLDMSGWLLLGLFGVLYVLGLL